MASGTVELEEQQEKLRRVVDEWRCRSHDLLKNLYEDPYGSSSFSDAYSSNSAPICVHAEPSEHSDISTLIELENVLVSKFVTVLSYDCIEISKLTEYARRNIYRQLSLFGHGSSSQVLLEGEPQKTFGRSLSLFMDLSEVTSRMSAVLCNLLQQLDSIYSLQDKNGTPCKSFKNATFTTAFSSFSDGLAMFLILDEILIHNGRIKSYLSLFARMLNKMKFEPDDFGIALGDLDNLDQVASRLEKLLDGGFFRELEQFCHFPQHLLQENPSWVDVLQKVRQNRKFLDACTSFIHNGLSEILSRLDTWKESLLDRRKILCHTALFLFEVYAAAEMPDKRLGKVIAQMLQVVPVIYCEGGGRFMLLDLLRNQFPPSLSSWYTLRDAAMESGTTKNNYLIHLNDMHSRDWQPIKDALACWVVSFQSVIHPMTDLSKVEVCLRLHFKKIIQGILIASRMQMMANSMLDLHALLEVPIKRERLKSLCQMVVLMKVVESAFHNKELDIIKSLPHIISFIQADIEQFFLRAKDELESEIAKGSQVGKMRFLSSLTRGSKDVESRMAYSLSLILLSLQMLRGGGSSKRRLILLVALDFLESIGYLDIGFSRIKKLISKLEMVVDFQSIVKGVTNCSFLYQRKEMIGTWLSMVYMDVDKFSWLQYLLDAFCDGLWHLKLGHVGEFTIHAHEKEIENAVKYEIIAPLCRDIETDLRLHVHSTHLKGSVHVNPRKTGVQNLSWYLQLKPLRIPFKNIDIKLHVETYLNSTFYNHTAMSSYDRKIYLEMRQLAKLKYRLVLDDIHFADHCLGHGIEVIETLQNLQKVATSYSYNITNQVLIEKASGFQGRTTLRIVGVEQVASSLATHGLVSIFTAIESVPKFLAQKLVDLSELLQDNFASSFLVKEFRFWKHEEGSIRNNPFIQGDQHNLTMGKLFFEDHELRYLEQLRYIISEMGNVLGLLRILKAGCSRHVCNISRFIHGSNNSKSFREISEKLGFMDETVTAGRIVDVTLESKYRIKDHLNCFSSLFTVFSKEIQSSKNIPFKDFHLIVPALVISLVDSRANCKDKLLRRSRDRGNQIVMDDGFIMGVAFLLKVTMQEKSFDQMYWFTGMHKYLKEALLSLEEYQDAEQRKASRGISVSRLLGQPASSIGIEAQKGIDKLKKYQKEVEFIHSSFNIARTAIS
ncbi:PREDICTED: WASH complex subunit SWIP-like isoform X2 [Nelumbo nucifera]|uniref:WASH complex subunit SWIP-like isoform X2 n=1 Tax=Nelumbo nucifera TaxID=4432 RepID=A0A1U8QAX8_NELNU|nr:PREDICTED: WASH complex subunit SWIP-like isoform X2 [Nelumbo nucifera]